MKVVKCNNGTISRHRTFLAPLGGGTPDDVIKTKCLNFSWRRLELHQLIGPLGFMDTGRT